MKRACVVLALLLGLFILGTAGGVQGTPPRTEGTTPPGTPRTAQSTAPPTRSPRGASQELARMAEGVPADVRGFVAFDLGSRTSMPSLLQGLRAYRRAMIPRVTLYEGLNFTLPWLVKLQVAATKALFRLEREASEVGMDLDDLAPGLAPAGWIAWFPRRSATPEARPATHLVLALRVADARVVDAVLLQGSGPRCDVCRGKVLDHAVSVGPRGHERWAWARRGDELLVASSHASLLATIQAREGRSPRLSDQPRFADAARRIPARQGLLAWMLTPSTSDGATQALAAALPYVLVARDEERAETRAFLKVDPKSSHPLARALLSPPASPDRVTARCIPSRLGSYLSGSLRWQLDCAQALCRSLPEHSRLDFGAEIHGLLGLDLERDLLAVTGGHYALSANLAEVLPLYLASLRDPSQPCPEVTGLLAVDLKDARQGQAAMSRVLAALKLVAGSATNAGQAPPTWRADGRGLHVAWTVLSSPSPVLLAAVGPRAEALLEEARACATAPGTSVASLASLRDVLAAQRGPVVYADTWNGSTLLDVARKSAWGQTVQRWQGRDPGEVAREFEGLPYDFASSVILCGWLLDLPRFSTLDGPTVVALAPDGLEITTRSALFDPGLLLASEAPPLWEVFLALTSPSPPRATDCRSNLKNIGTALEMYSTDSSGLYPAALSALTPNYLKRIPTCPAAGQDTYSTAYVRAASADAYTVCCGGHHHASTGCPPNFPQYSSTHGLMEGKP